MRKHFKNAVTLLEHVSFLWLGLFAEFVVHDKTIWYVQQAIAAIATVILYVIICIATKGRTTNAVAMLFGGVAMGLLWYEMALYSLFDMALAVLLFTLPVLAIWSLRTSLVYEERFQLSSLAWLGVVVIGLVTFALMSPARPTFGWRHDRDVARHSLRAALAGATVFLAVVTIVAHRAHVLHSQFSLRSFLLATSAAAMCLALCVKLNPVLPPNWNRHSHISVRFVEDGSRKRLTYSVRVFSNGQLVAYQFEDYDPGDGQFEVVIARDPSHRGLCTYSKRRGRFVLGPPTQRMSEVWTKIQHATQEPLKAHEAVWETQHSLEQPIWEGDHQSFENKLIVPLPDEPATRETYRLHDAAGNLLP